MTHEHGRLSSGCDRGQGSSRVELVICLGARWLCTRQRETGWAWGVCSRPDFAFGLLHTPLSLSSWACSPAARLPHRSGASLMLTVSHTMCPGIQHWGVSVRTQTVVPAKAMAAMRSSPSSRPAQGAERPSGGVGTVWPQSSRGSTYTYVLHSRLACLGERLRLWATALICWAFAEGYLRFLLPD